MPARQSHSLEALLSVITDAHLSPEDTTSIAVSPPPRPYVPPTFHFPENQATEHLTSDVIFVQAPAAVGKSTTAKYISSRTKAPLLNLAQIAVGQDSFHGILARSFPAASDPVSLFHQGNLPIVVDALDEGLIFSRDRAFENFLISTGRFLSEGSPACRPKVLFFGRPGSADLSKLGLTLEPDAPYSVCLIELDYFDQPAALQLIDASAQEEIDRLESIGKLTATAARSRKHRLAGQPMTQLKSAYFSAIESALGIDPGALWDNDVGRAFSGYAPVLSTLGALIADADNPLLITNQLSTKASGSYDAWEVISTVLQDVLSREQAKVQEILGADMHGSVPPNAYDATEQLTYLSQLLHKQPISATGTVTFSTNAQLDLYVRTVRQNLGDHPFMRDGDMANVVLGSAIIAHAISRGAPHENLPDSVRSVSRQPFLWRHMRKRFAEEEVLLDGSNLGYLLTSYWNDPVVADRPVTIHESEDIELIVVALDTVSDTVEFRVVPPLTIYGVMRHCYLNCPSATVLIEGGALTKGDSSTFSFSTESTLVCREARFRCDSIKVRGKLRMVADSVDVVSSREVDVFVDDGAEISLSAAFRRYHFWNNVVVNWVEHGTDDAEQIGQIVGVLKSTPNRTVVLLNDYGFPEDEVDRGMRRCFRSSNDARVFFKLLVEHGLAERTRFQSSGGDAKFRIIFQNVDWDQVEKALRGEPVGDTSIREFASAVKGRLTL